MPTYRITAPDGRKFKLTGDSPPTEQEIEEAYAKLPPIEQTQQEPLKTIGDINPLYLYLPNYIPVIFLAIFIFLIFKKKIKKGWTRLITFLSVIWLLIVLGYSQMIIDYNYSYYKAMRELPEDIKNCLFWSIVPIAFMFFVGWSLKWIVAGFKENK